MNVVAKKIQWLKLFANIVFRQPSNISTSLNGRSMVFPLNIKVETLFSLRAAPFINKGESMAKTMIALSLLFVVSPAFAEDEPKLPKDLKLPEGCKPFIMTADSMRTAGNVKVSQKVDVWRNEPIVEGKTVPFQFVDDVLVVHVEPGKRKGSVAYIVLAVTPQQLKKIKAPEKAGFWILKERSN